MSVVAVFCGLKHLNTLSSNDMSSSSHRLSIMLIIIFSIGIYANGLNNGFVYDDSDTVVNNVLIKDLGNLPRLLHESYFSLSGEASYRPIRMIVIFLSNKHRPLKVPRSLTLPVSICVCR